jgi:pentatricopeptide repeat protein
MDAFLKQGGLEAPEMVFHTFQEMQDAGVAPTAVTYGCLLLACGRERRVDYAFELYQRACDEMRRRRAAHHPVQGLERYRTAHCMVQGFKGSDRGASPCLWPRRSTWLPSSACDAGSDAPGAGLPVNLIGSPINYANHLIGSPITSQSTGRELP